MRANYCFLINIEPNSSDKEIVGEAHTAFEAWANEYCDENNSYAYEAIILQDGRGTAFAPDDDGGKRLELWEEALGEMPQVERWEWARLYALKCVANEFELAGRSSIGFAAEPPVENFWSSFDTLFARICKEVPAKLARLWAEVPLNFTTASTTARIPHQLKLDNYHRDRWSRQLTLLLAAHEYNLAPFAIIGTPNEYRAFDIRDFRNCEDMDDNLAILIVNIHT